MTKTIVKPRTKVRPKTQRPPLYKVILLNDDYTPRTGSGIRSGATQISCRAGDDSTFAGQRLAFCLCVIFSENRCRLFGITH